MSIVYKVLIVTIVKDRPQDLETTIKSVSQQTYQSLHHFVIDGSSGTQVMDLIAKGISSKSISAIFEKDNGIYEAMNKWRLCNIEFDFICWLNAGDSFYSESTVEKIIQSYEINKWRWSYGNMLFINARGQIWRTPRQTPFNYLFFRFGVRWIPHGSVFMTKEFLISLGEYRTDVGPAADQEFLLRAAQVVLPYAQSDTVLLFEDGGISSNLQGLKREVSWHSFRVLNNCCIFKSERVDFLFIPIFVIFQWVSRLLSRIIRISSIYIRL